MPSPDKLAARIGPARVSMMHTVFTAWPAQMNIQLNSGCMVFFHYWFIPDCIQMQAGAGCVCCPQSGQAVQVRCPCHSKPCSMVMPASSALYLFRSLLTCHRRSAVVDYWLQLGFVSEAGSPTASLAFKSATSSLNNLLWRL